MIEEDGEEFIEREMSREEVEAIALRRGEIENINQSREDDVRLSGILAFLAVDKFGGFAEASRAIGVGEDTLRKRVRGLENFLGQKLFARRPLTFLSVDGFKFKPVAQQIVQMLDDFRARTSMTHQAKLKGIDPQKWINESMHPIYNAGKFSHYEVD